MADYLYPSVRGHMLGMHVSKRFERIDELAEEYQMQEQFIILKKQYW